MAEIAEDIRGLIEHLAKPVTFEDVEQLVASRARDHETPRRRFRTRTSLIAAPVIAVGITFALILVLGVLPGTEKPQSAVAAVLDRAATVATKQRAGATPGRGQYLFYRTVQGLLMIPSTPLGSEMFPLLYTQTTETWVSTDGSGRQRIAYSAPSLVVPSEQPAWVAAGSPQYHPPASDTYFPTNTNSPVGGPVHRGLNSEWYLAYLDTSQFPTNPTVLQKYMNKYFGITGGATTTFFIAGNMLQEGASPALRAALFKLVEQLPGVALIPHAHDAMGRSGVGVVLNEKQHGLRHVLVFDPKSSAVLGEEDFVGPGKFASRVISVPRGTLVGFTEYGPTAVVASTSVVSR